jgi:hypothetical protein
MTAIIPVAPMLVLAPCLTLKQPRQIRYVSGGTWSLADHYCCGQLISINLVRGHQFMSPHSLV